MSKLSDLEEKARTLRLRYGNLDLMTDRVPGQALGCVPVDVKLVMDDLVVLQITPEKGAEPSTMEVRKRHAKAHQDLLTVGADVAKAGYRKVAMISLLEVDGRAD